MSKYEETKTVFTDGDHLVAALQELGYDPLRMTNPIHLTGYHGDTRPEVAHIVIPRDQIGSASNDIGFVREDGVYRAIISQFDSRSPQAKYGAGVIPTSTGFNVNWLGRLSQAYKERQTMAVAKSKGYVFQGRTMTAQGKVQLKFSVR
jgi:hypothetical protein